MRSAGGWGLGVRALAAGAEDLDGVADVDEAVVLGHLVGPALDRGPVHLDGESARAAHEMVVVTGRAAPVDGLPAVGAQHVDGAGFGKGLQGAVDGGQADALAAPAQFVVQVLGRTEFFDLVEQRGDRTALSGGADSDDGFGGGRHGWGQPSSTWATASTTMWARWSSTRR
ncbi:hypothetical protein RHRU231_910053 [Rhodococcus ruber]|uniref:Uncharacterized protein n=1 Tax=Rhodococcus ruber TaxID=1830 RepID=A0A098BTE7_9NOCA|nr:hypothetical protein RHRU231_910053 [Rhodococcus ruber]